MLLADTHGSYCFRHTGKEWPNTNAYEYTHTNKKHKQKQGNRKQKQLKRQKKVGEGKKIRKEKKEKKKEKERTRWKKVMLMIAFININSGLVLLIEGLCAQILYFRFVIIGGLRKDGTILQVNVLKDKSKNADPSLSLSKGASL